MSPANDGEIIRLNIPPLTEERRRDLVKKVKGEIEVARVNIRKVRQEANEELKKIQKDGGSEDEVKKAEERVQKMTDSYIQKAEQLMADKEKDIMVQWMDDLATGLTAVIQVLDPEVIVLGGAVIVNHKWIIEGLQEKIQKKVFGSLSEKVKLVPAQSDSLSGIMGAAYYALKKIKGEYQVEK